MKSDTKHAEMCFDYKLLPAIFEGRPNRFLTIVRLNGEQVTSHLPDPGRLQELLIPGARVLLKREDGPNRKTKYSTQAVYQGETLISLNTLLPNRFVALLLKEKILSEFSDWRVKKREARCGNSRFDFLLQNPAGEELWLEVKSVTFVEQGIARFPDAVTARGARHLRHLAQMSRAGKKCAVLFLVQRSDAALFKPYWQRDPDLGEALVNAHGQGVKVYVISAEVTPDKMIYRGKLPFELGRE
ncbi:MAG: DNA/RNA nuclease SfsA [FCB group bacterium]|nr:DNA/RNA nuclease SfsA [FCB group bacterium]